jgi:Putative Actinobacterial Holin-X, holin superfamily III
MPTPVSEHQTTVQNGGLGDAAKHVAEHASSIVRLELELAALELKTKVTSLGIGIGMALGAAVFGLFALGFAFATVAAALATFLSTWLALLIVTLFLGALASVLLVLGLSRIKRGTPPVPEQAIREAKLTTEAIKS